MFKRHWCFYFFFPISVDVLIELTVTYHSSCLLVPALFSAHIWCSHFFLCLSSIFCWLLRFLPFSLLFPWKAQTSSLELGNPSVGFLAYCCWFLLLLLSFAACPCTFRVKINGRGALPLEKSHPEQGEVLIYRGADAVLNIQGQDSINIEANK